MYTPDTSRRNLLLLSNSRDEAGRFLQHTRDDLSDQFAGVCNIVFVPFAGVTISWDAYANHVAEAMKEIGIVVQSVHGRSDAVSMVRDAEAIAVGGGNTFHLLANVQRAGLLDVIRERALAGTPYLGWSAGSVIACPTMQTTNDMPITEPDSFRALGLVQFQINAHFTDAHPLGFQGETRRQRLAEFVTANASARVVGLPEGTWLRVAGASVELHGQHDAVLFRAGVPDTPIARNVELSGLLEP
ncbi:MAG: dipeptidase PepE [Phycisphaerae bacterium]|nr:dipeptidase PepE [Gemmatimonadaceae bacterium]